MNIEILNTVNLDGTTVTYQSISNSGGGNSGGGGSTPKWTGHADAEGLKAIGWTDEDIAYYQATGVNWNKEDDEWHKVTDDNKSLYGKLTASNISEYKYRIVYLPKINTSGVTDMVSMFLECIKMVAIPLFDTSNVTTMGSMFSKCHSLTSIPQLDTSKVASMFNMFGDCRSLTSIPMLDTSNVTTMSNMFQGCSSLTSIPQLDTSNVTNMSYMFQNCSKLTTIPQLDTSNVTNMNYMFHSCSSLTSIPQLDTSNVKDMGYMLSGVRLITHIPQFNMGKVKTVSSMFSGCENLREIPPLNMPAINYNCSSLFYNCIKLKTVAELDINISFTSSPYSNMVFNAASLETIYLKNIMESISFGQSAVLNKDSLLYMINNAKSYTITITLASYAYERLANDPDILAALASHTNISLASA